MYRTCTHVKKLHTTYTSRTKDCTLPVHSVKFFYTTSYKEGLPCARLARDSDIVLFYHLIQRKRLFVVQFQESRHSCCCHKAEMTKHGTFGAVQKSTTGVDIEI